MFDNDGDGEAQLTTQVSHRVGRIIFLASHLQPRYGMEKAAVATASLLERSYAVEVITIGDQKSAGSNPPVDSLGSRLRGIHRLVSLPRLFRHWRRFDAEVIVLVGVWAAMPWLLVEKVRKSACVVIIWEHSLMRERLSASKKLLILSKVADLLYRRADAIVAVSPMLADDLAGRVLACDIAYIPNLIVSSDNKGSETTDQAIRVPYRLLMVGSLTPLKRHCLALETLALLDEKFTLTIIGDGDERASLHSQVQRLGLTERVHFAGYLLEDEVADQFTQHDLLLHCSAIETFGLVLVEAANAGIRVLATANRTTQWLIPTYVPGVVTDAEASNLKLHVESESRRLDEAPDSEQAYIRRRDEFGAARVSADWRNLISDMIHTERGEKLGRNDLF